MHIVIIGNGIAGITAARTIRKLSEHEVTVISSESRYFFSRTALMYVYTGQMRLEDTMPYETWFWDKNRISLIQDHVDHLDPGTRQLRLRQRGPLSYDRLILATGSRSDTLSCPGFQLEGVQGLYSIQDLQSLEERTPLIREAVVIGGGLIGIELAEMLLTRGIHVTIIVREPGYYRSSVPAEESLLIGREIHRHGIRLVLHTDIRSFEADAQGSVSAVHTTAGERIPCQFAGVTIGVRPQVGIPGLEAIDIDEGILVNADLSTSIPGIYAAGDCAQLRSSAQFRKPIEPVWYTARMMGEIAGHNVCGYQIPYEQGTWFNSAKFITIECQVYGYIPPDPVATLASLFWQHPDGQKSIRITFDPETSAVLGFLLMGIRYRQDVCEKWIREKTPVEDVLARLSLANFDGEFSRQYEHEVVATYNQKYQQNVLLSGRRNANASHSFITSR